MAWWGVRTRGVRRQLLVLVDADCRFAQLRVALLLGPLPDALHVLDVCGVCGAGVAAAAAGLRGQLALPRIPLRHERGEGGLILGPDGHEGHRAEGGA